eukprot:g6012.t1
MFMGVTQLVVDTGSASLYAGALYDTKEFTDDQVVVPGTKTPQWRTGTNETLEAVKPWIESDPDVDAVVIVDVHGPAIQHPKWIYATGLPYIQIEPAWLFGLSAGVLFPRVFDAGTGEGKETRAIDAYIAAGDWPLADLRRNLAAAPDDEDDDLWGNKTQVKTDFSMNRDECQVEAERLVRDGCYIYVPNGFVYWNKGKKGLCSAKRICLALAPDNSTSAAPGSSAASSSDYNPSQEIYHMLATGLSAPLTRDVLAFKTPNATKKYVPNGIGGLRAIDAQI